MLRGQRTMTRRAHRLLVAARAAGALLMLACADARAEQELRVSGTGTALGALHRLADAFARANPGHRLRALPSVGSSGAIRAVADGRSTSPSPVVRSAPPSSRPA